MGVCEAGNGGGAGGGDVEDARVGERVLEAQPGAALLRGGDRAALAGGARGVGHGVGLVEDDDALEGVASVFVEGSVATAGEPGDDLVEARGLVLAGRAAQRRVGGEEDAFVEGYGVSLPDLAEGEDVCVAPAEGGPVAAGVLEQFVGLGDPEGALASAQPLVEDDGGDLASLAAPRSVSEHPALAEAHRGRKAFGRLGVGGVVVVPGFRGGRVGAVDAAHGFPSRADAVSGGEMSVMRLPGEDDAFELGVGEQAVGHDLRGQQRPVCRRGVGDGGHGGGLDEGRGMGPRAGDADGARAPGFVRPRVRARRVVVVPAFGAGGLVGEFGDGSPPVGGGRRRGARGPALARRRTERRRAGEREQVGGRRRGQPGQVGGADGGEQFGGVRDRSVRIELRVRARFGVPVENGEPRVEGRAPPRIGASVDGGGEADARRRVEALEGGVPAAVAGDGVGGGDGDEAPAGGQHRESRPDVPQVGSGAAPGDARRRRERRVHQNHAGRGVRQAVGDGLGVVRRDRGAGGTGRGGARRGSRRSR